MSRANIDFDKKGNVIIYPCWQDEFGISRTSNKYLKLESTLIKFELSNFVFNSNKLSITVLSFFSFFLLKNTFFIKALEK